MFVFFDTEFTNLLNPRLVSLGFVAENEDCLYLEVCDWTKGECSDFVLEVVLPLLGPVESRVSDLVAAARITKWIATLGEPVQLICDANVDLWLLRELFFEAELEMPTSIQDLSAISLSRDGEMVRENLYDATLRRHHALDDAKALLAGWRRDRG